MGRIFLVLCLAALSGTSALADGPRWERLPETPALHNAKRSGYAPINGVRIWYAIFGSGEPVIMLHGGLANSNYWGYQVPVLSKQYQVIVMDSRGHGRSTRDETPYSYHLMAKDVIGLMDFLKIRKAAIVGWSDGAILGLDIAINYPDRLSKLFAFGANSDPSGGNEAASTSPVFLAYLARTEKEYAKLSPTPDQYKSFLNQISKMWAIDPHFTAEQLGRITVPTWIVDGDRDEAIRRENTEFMAAQIPNAGLLIQPEVSHFSFLQDPNQFNNDVLHFLAYPYPH
jgi:pimeloyl-ACP methyl ester carboxylesterase